MKNYIKITTLLITLFLASCVQKEYEKTVTISVDMNGVENFTSVGIRGNFLPNKWQKSYPLTDINNDGIYEATFKEKTAVYGIQFKFVIDNIDYELKNFENRKLLFEYKPETIVYSTKYNQEKPIEITRR